MKSNNGTNINYTLFGESHSAAVGITIQGLPTGFKPDFNLIEQKLIARSGGASFNTPRQEKNNYQILCGLFEGKLTGTPLTIVFPNSNTQSKDYSHLVTQPRPGHADFVAKQKYENHQDYRGGGHFSGRLTTPIVFLGELCRQIIVQKVPNFQICTHIKQFSKLQDTSYYQIRSTIVKNILQKHLSTNELTFTNVSKEQQKLIIKEIYEMLKEFEQHLTTLDPSFPCIDQKMTHQMITEALKCKANGDSLGGELETIIISPPHSLGEPFFNSVESTLAKLILSIPSVKSINFGATENFVKKLGSKCKDEIWSFNPETNQILTPYNFNAGINGGITNGEHIVFSTICKPISSIGQAQSTFNFETMQVEQLEIGGRHDSTVINRIIPVINAVSAITILDLYLENEKSTSFR